MRMFSNWWRGAGAGLVLVGGVFGACVDDAAEDPEVAARKAKGLVLVCHETGNGKVIPLELPAPAAEAHEGHGDVVGGDTCEDAGEQLDCKKVADCPALECSTATACVKKQCVYTPLPEGTEVAEQVTGDCHVQVCDGAGGVIDEIDMSDLLDDGIACTKDSCEGGEPVNDPQTQECPYGGPAGTEYVGVCVPGTRTCDLETGEFGACEGEVLPSAEVCTAEHLDEDCDGSVEEEGDGCSCGDGYVQAGEDCDDGNNEPGDGCSPTCKLKECSPGPGEVDQANIGGVFAGTASVNATANVGQSITIGKDGVLTAIEFNLQRCVYPLEGVLVELTLLDEDDAILAKRTVPAEAFPIHCGDGLPLDAEQLGPGAFDLSDACITVSTGQVLRANFRLLDAPDVDCQDGQCSNAFNFQCGVGETCRPNLQTVLSANSYAGGTEIINGLPIQLEDMRFKVLVD